MLMNSGVNEKMEMPIIKPSMVSYADELNFLELLEDLLNKKHNGFIRVTSGSDEGYILFRDGEQVAASYGRHSKSKAVETMKSAMEENNTVIEVFDIRQSQVDYLIDLNKPFLMEPDYDVYEVIGELKESDEDEDESAVTESLGSESSEMESTEIESSETGSSEMESAETESPWQELERESDTNSESAGEAPLISSKSDINAQDTGSEPEPETEVKIDPESVEGPSELSDASGKSEPGLTSEGETEVSREPPNISEGESEAKTSGEAETPSADSPQEEPETELETAASVLSEIENSQSKDESTPSDISKLPSPPEAPPTSVPTEFQGEENEYSYSDLVEPNRSSTNSVKSEFQKESIDRMKLLKKYGIKEINDTDVDNILLSYKGGSIEDEDVEKIELTLMNKIKKSIFGIPKIRGAEVMVFLENARDLSGSINIIIEYEAKGFFSRLIGESRDVDNLRRQVINIAQIEIKKSFRKYPEIIDKFDINVEIS